MNQDVPITKYVSREDFARRRGHHRYDTDIRMPVYEENDDGTTKVSYITVNHTKEWTLKNMVELYVNPNYFPEERDIWIVDETMKVLRVMQCRVTIINPGDE